MANLNRVTLIGNLTRDPEIKYTTKGSAVTDITLAVNRNYKVGDERKEEVTFIDITLWGKLAEIAADHLHKGSSAYVEGRLFVEQWEDKETGKNRSKLKVVGEAIQFLGGKHQTERTGSRTPARNQEDEGIPF